MTFSLVRHNERNETYVGDPARDRDAVEPLWRRCDTLTVRGPELIVWTAP